MTQPLTYQQAARRIGCSLRQVQRLIQEGELPRVRDGRHSNGKIHWAIPAQAVEIYRGGAAKRKPSCPAMGQTSFPISPPGPPRPTGRPDAQLKTIGPGSHDPPDDAERIRQASGLPPSIPLTPTGLPDLTALKVGGYNELVRDYEHRAHAVYQLKARLASADYGQLMAIRIRTAAEFDVAESTLRRWESDFDTAGWAALMPARDIGPRDPKSIPKELRRQVLDAYLYQGKYNAMQIFERVVLPYCRENSIDAPHPRTVRAFLARVPPLVRTVSREGRRAYQEQHEVRVMRDLEAAGVNSWWVSDHRLADAFVLVADGQGAGWGKFAKLPCPCGSGLERRACCSARRLWWTFTVDVCTARIVGRRFSLQPTAATVCHMLRQAILDLGLPDHWIRDWGKEFTADRLHNPRNSDLAGKRRWPAAMPHDVEQTSLWKGLNVTVHTTIPYSAWSKYAESIFSAFSRRYENYFPCMTGRSPKSRPEKLQKELERGEILTADQYVEVMDRMLDEWDNEHPVGDRKWPPALYYKDYYARARERLPHPADLSFMLQAERETTISQGRIRLDGRQYFSDTISPYSGCQVTVRWDPGMPDWIYVYPDPSTCIAVAEVPKAQYGAWTESNALAKCTSRAQRDFVREWALPVKGACPRDRMDAFGAHAIAHDNARRPSPDVALQEQAREAADKPPERPISIYTKIHREHERRRKALKGA